MRPWRCSANSKFCLQPNPGGTTYSLSYRDLVETMPEGGLTVDQVTIWPWVQRYGPILVQWLGSLGYPFGLFAFNRKLR